MATAILPEMATRRSAAPAAAGATWRKPAFAIGRIVFQASVIILLLLVNQAGFAGNIFFFGVLLYMVSRGKEWPVKALTIMYLGLICNQWYVPKNSFWTVARFVVPFAVLFQATFDMATLRVSLLKRGYYLFHLLFIAVSVVLTIMTGYFVHISLLKLLNYTTVTTVVFAEAEIQRARRYDFAEWFLTLITATLILGFAALPLGIAYNAKSFVQGGALSFFNGPFYHSNALGPFSALMATYLACVFLFGRYRNRWYCAALFVGLLTFMRWSQSRTAFAALIVGLLVMLAATFFLRRRGWMVLRMNTRRSMLLAGVAGLVIGAYMADGVTGGTISKKITGFINKSQNTAELSTRDLFYSRGGKIQTSWGNFLESPWIGIGFEVAKDEAFARTATIVNAPVEKGFLPTAILEQSGIIGTFFFVLTLISFLGYLVVNLNVPGVVLFLTFLTVNCGEVMYFGVAGHGALGWLIVLGGVMLGDWTVRDVRAPDAGRGRRIATAAAPVPVAY